MSEAALRSLELAREKALERQQTCAFCGKDCQNADHLFMHIVLRHPKEEK